MAGCEVYDLVPRLPGMNVVQNRWVFATKTNNQGEVYRRKARLVAKGFSQKEGVDYFETFAPVMSHISLRLILALCAVLDYEIKQFDVTTAFLNASLKEDIYMEQPEGFVTPGKENCVWKLKKALYGLPQSPRE